MTSPAAIQSPADPFDAIVLRRARPAGAGVARLEWRAPEQGDRIVQVYVNRRLYDATPDPDARSLWLHLDPAASEPLIELLAVEPARAWDDHAASLHAFNPTLQPRADLVLARDEALAFDARVEVRVDDRPHARSPLWADRDCRAGFGAAFGVGGFGLDDATGPGLGRAPFGAGPFGRDGTPWRWASDRLQPGQHTVDALALDPNGRRIAALHAPAQAAIAMPPQTPERLDIESSPTGLRLRWA